MDSESIMLSEISKKERQIWYDLTYMWNLENKTKTALIDRKKRLVIATGRVK